MVDRQFTTTAPFSSSYDAQPWAGEVLILPWEDGLAMLELPTMSPMKDLEKLRKTGEHRFRRTLSQLPMQVDPGEAEVAVGEPRKPLERLGGVHVPATHLVEQRLELCLQPTPRFEVWSRPPGPGRLCGTARVVCLREPRVYALRMAGTDGADTWVGQPLPRRRHEEVEQVILTRRRVQEHEAAGARAGERRLGHERHQRARDRGLRGLPFQPDPRCARRASRRPGALRR